VVIAGGLGGFQPRKPNFEGIKDFEEKGVSYFIKEPKIYNDKNVIISGGGDSALDWTIELSKIAKRVTLVHRRNEFRGANDSVEKVQKLKDDSKIDLITPAEVFKLEGSENLEKVFIKKENEEIQISADFFIPLFGLTPKLGSISDWGLNIDKNSIVVNNSLDYQTNIPGVFAIGDINTYPGKLNLILCGFHEAALMCQAAFKIINPDKKFVLKYTTVSGVAGFDGSLKKAESSVVKTIK
jgi:thioredoxin reductase (NADPH)